MIDKSGIKARFDALAPFLNERDRRLFAASEARAAGRGGIAAVAEVTGIARSTIGRGLTDLRSGSALCNSRVRRPGGGGKPATETQPGLLAALEELVQSSIRGDPEAPLRWVSKSQRHLSAALTACGFGAGQKLVGRLLGRLGFSLQANRKTREGTQHPDRNAQFEHINATVADFQAAGEPAISVDTKKKELVGDFKNGGRELRPKGRPEAVRVHDFVIPALGKAVPYGVYDIAANAGWVSVGMNHDTAAFAVEAIRRWWHELGAARYPAATKLLITADCGGSNGARVRLWKRELQVLADELGIAISVCHLPPGTSKWNRIEHRLFAFITQNWRGKPLVSHQVIVQLIASTTTKTGLTVACRLDTNSYEKGIKVSDADIASLNIQPANFHGEWNYTFIPRAPDV
ncbi:ISAzo13 family transposase [Acidiphilium sp. C61]|uniref:ISAzo13 family transposase n=1 Tax=Acidiphilium sp. C61 TaxID=1671485 RepID=UPI00157A7466|nr:ISAzo13 family transposase [Acidiphilium sp. C61]